MVDVATLKTLERLEKRLELMEQREKEYIRRQSTLDRKVTKLRNMVDSADLAGFDKFASTARKTYFDTQSRYQALLNKTIIQSELRYMLRDDPDQLIVIRGLIMAFDLKDYYWDVLSKWKMNYLYRLFKVIGEHEELPSEKELVKLIQEHKETF